MNLQLVQWHIGTRYATYRKSQCRRSGRCEGQGVSTHHHFIHKSRIEGRTKGRAGVLSQVAAMNIAASPGTGKFVPVRCAAAVIDKEQTEETIARIFIPSQTPAAF